MVGGRGSWFWLLIDNIFKLLFKVGDKFIIEYNIDCLCSFGIDDFWIFVCYLGE